MDFSEKYIALSSHKCFAGLSDNELSVIADACHFYEFDLGDKILQADSLAMQVFIILDGSLVENNSNFKDIFGVKYIIKGDLLPYDVYSDNQVNTRCLVVSREHFTSAIRNCPMIIVNIIKISEGQ